MQADVGSGPGWLSYDKKDLDKVVLSYNLYKEQYKTREAWRDKIQTLLIQV